MTTNKKLSLTSNNDNIEGIKESKSFLRTGLGTTLDLYCTVKVDGEVKRHFKSESFLQSFASTLYRMMHGGRATGLGLKSPVFDDDVHQYFGRAGYFDIATNNAGNPLQIQGNNFYRHSGGFVDYDQENPSYVIIEGAPSQWNGFYLGRLVNSETVELYDLDGNPIDGTSATSDLNNGRAALSIGWHNQPIAAFDFDGNNTGNMDARMIQNWQLIVGRGNESVQIDDMYLHDRVSHGSGDGQLNHGNRSVSPLVTDKPTSRFTISKSFTNQGSTDISINEIGVISSSAPREDANGIPLMQVRDVLNSSVLIPSGGTLTVDYELVVRLTPDTQDTDTDGTNGGFLESFMSIIRDLAIGNNSQAAYYLRCADFPGESTNLPVRESSFILNDEIRNWGLNYLGIRLGTDNQFTSMTDAGLNIPTQGVNGIEHGSEDGELFHYGCWINNLQVDKQNNKVTFDISRIFENKGSTSITVREKGLWAQTTPDYQGFSNSLIARIALAPGDQFTINPGEYRKVTFTVEVVA